jgi:hypothetical protein
LTSVMIPGSVTSIGENAFSGCYDLTNFTILNGVTIIGAQAFSGCSGLTSITIPGNGITIGSNAFYLCYNLTNIVLPGSVSSIGLAAFQVCDALAGVYFGGNAPAVDSTAFGYDLHYTDTTVYYLPGTTGWSSNFAGVPTALWYLPHPTILNNASNFGVQGKMFGFTISWATNISFVVEASANLAGSVWTPIQTNTLSNGSFYFSEPVQTNGVGRFYRISAR